jgi:uncharacterized protein YbjT (DUF2867 family)
MTGKILVIGSTGTIGTPLMKALLSKGESVKAASRSGNAMGGAEGVRFDYTDASTYADASTALTVCSSSWRAAVWTPSTR